MTGVQIALYTWCPLMMLSFSTVPRELQLAAAMLVTFHVAYIALYGIKNSFTVNRCWGSNKSRAQIVARSKLSEKNRCPGFYLDKYSIYIYLVRCCSLQPIIIYEIYSV